MPSPSKCEPLTDTEAALLLSELERDGEVAVARASGVHRQTLNRASNKRVLYSTARARIRDYLHAVSLSRAV